VETVFYARKTGLWYALPSSWGEDGMSMGARPSQEQLLALLQTAKNRLQYLSHNDWTLLVDHAKQVTFKKGDVLIQQGSQSKMLYVIAAGKVKVSVLGTAFAQIGAGEVCGEMAFLEDSGPSATATAEEEVQAFCIEWPKLIELFELFPHLGSRFYRSLAVNLSRRLREQIVLKKR
jgi:extracellular factor (EF) 3-hydroxypalmitic acid methyl ester biosynthesis protein